MPVTQTWVCDECGRKAIVGGTFRAPSGWALFMGTSCLCPACDEVEQSDDE